MLSLSAIFVALVAAAAVLVALYVVFYTFWINRRIREGVVTGRRLVDPPKAVMGAVIVVLAVICGLLIYDANHQPAHTVSRNSYAEIDASVPGRYEYVAWAGSPELGDASFAEAYSLEENPGYEKQVTVDGDFVFTVFTRTSPADSFHPDFLCFLSYTGEREEGLSLFTGGYFAELSEDGAGSGSGSAGGTLYDCLLYIGNLDGGCSFTVTAAILDKAAETAFQQAMLAAMKADKGAFPAEKDFARSYGSVTLTIR